MAEPPPPRSASPHPVRPPPQATRQVHTHSNAPAPALGPPQQRPRAMFRVVTATVKLQLAGSVRGEVESDLCRLPVVQQAEPSRARRYVWGSDSLSEQRGKRTFRARSPLSLSGSALFFFYNLCA